MSRTSEGLRFHVALAFVGAVPPPHGEARTRFLDARGTREFSRSLQLLHSVEQSLRSASPGLKFPYASLAVLGCDDPVQRQRDAWERARVALAGTLEELPGESDARRSLNAAVLAALDLNETDKAALAHRHLHRIAELVSGLFGCWMEWDARQKCWFDTCPATLAHYPYGVSPGFTSVRLCSLCREDISVCPHLSETPYEVVATRDPKGICSVCAFDSCEHVPGRSYTAYQRSIVSDVTLHEGSLVERPREPWARVTGMEFRQARPPRKHERLRCHTCLLPCTEPRLRGGTGTGVPA